MFIKSNWDIILKIIQYYIYKLFNNSIRTNIELKYILIIIVYNIGGFYEL